jgi:glycosyltransferase involved in cell wall biosynthesis/predicted O-methyltransferase YrrM
VIRKTAHREDRTLRVVINAQLNPARSGGIAQVLVGLAHSLGRLDGREEYVFVCSPASAPWLKDFIGENSRIEVNEKQSPAPARGVRVSDGFWESFAPDVVHFPYQSYTEVDVPTVFNPHDLQHVHLPEFFSDEERARRERLYGEACRRASAVATASRFVKEDIVRQYGVDADKVKVIWWGSPTTAYDPPTDEQIAAALHRYDLPRDFAIYPAQTWPHKNHATLLKALSLLRDRCGVRVPLVCTGSKTDHWTELTQQVSKLRLDDQVWFVGRVEESELMALYHAARMMLVPTLFEAMSFPVFEAFAEGLPVACSNVTALPEQVGHGAVTFNPREPEKMASIILRIHRDESLRRTLIEQGRVRLKHFSWTETARRYRALYRRVAGRSDEAHPPTVHGKSTNPADEIADAVVKRAGEGATHQRLLDIWGRIEADRYLNETMNVLRRAIERGEPYWDLCCALAAYAELYAPPTYLEIGVRQGRSAVVVAAIRPDVDLFLFDMWHPNYADVPNPGPEFVRAQLARVGHRGSVYFGSGRSQETIPAFFAEANGPQMFDLITVDGDHRDAGARADLDNVAPHLAPGGMLAFDDICHPTYPTLRRTWESFLSEHPELIERANVTDAGGTAIAVRRLGIGD